MTAIAVQPRESFLWSRFAFLILTGVALAAFSGCSKNSASTADPIHSNPFYPDPIQPDPIYSNPPPLDLVQPSGSSPYLEVDQPVVIRFKEPVSINYPYTLEMDGVRVGGAETGLYHEVDLPAEPILDENGQPVEFPYDSLTLSPTGQPPLWRHDTQYVLTVPFRDKPWPARLSFRTPPAPPLENMDDLKNTLFSGPYLGLGDLFGTEASIISQYTRIDLSVSEIDSQGLTLKARKLTWIGDILIIGSENDELQAWPPTEFRSGGVFEWQGMYDTDSPLKNWLDFEVGRLPSAKLGFFGEITPFGIRWGVIYIEDIDCGPGSGTEFYGMFSIMNPCNNSSILLSPFATFHAGRVE